MPAADRQPGVLCLLGAEAPMRGLLAQLRGLGMHVDTAQGGADARTTFFAAGGCDCLVIAPDVRPGVAKAVLQALRCLDPELALASFCSSPDPGHRSLQVSLASYHPSSRAGTGALLRFLRTLRLR
ncbi:MAG: hypothetical protein WAT39_09190 [Planctomycetota bacterium]